MLFCFLLLFNLLLQSADKWPQFRGPLGDGHSDARDLALTWGESENVAWKIPIHDRGWSSPVIWGNQIWLTTADKDGRQLFALCIGQLFAVRTGGSGLLDASSILWRVKRGVPNKPSILLIDGLIFMVGDTGIASCIDAGSGESVWQKRIGDEYSASPVYPDGKIYFFSEQGKSVVIRPGRTFEQLAENMLGDGFLASPAISGRAFYLRSRTHLYRIEKMK
jgi:outer membrane protein assembly factor BamB